jgi:hypothetical protein
MSKIARLKIIRSILKRAGYLTNMVDARIQQLKQMPEGEPSKVDFKKPLATYIPGSQVMVPTDPFDATGGYNVMFVFRYRMDTNWSAGVKTIIVMTDTGTQYNATWVANALSRIQKSLQKVNPNAHLNKYGISAHSGGYTVAGRLLRQKDKLEKMVGKPLDAVVLADAGHEKLHPTLMNAYVDFAQEASKGDRNFISMHTAIPGIDYKGGKKRTYTSTTEHADYILDRVGLDRQHGSDESFSNWRTKPISVAEQGGLKFIQMDDDKGRAYNPKDRDAPGTSGHMHNETARHIPDAWKMMQGWS